MWSVSQQTLFVAAGSKALEKLLAGRSDANIRFDEMRRLLAALGFSERIRGDHHIFWRDGVEEIVNLQPRSGKVKPYQARQIRRLIRKYDLDRIA
jgi:hypothetical protein